MSRTEKEEKFMKKIFGIKIGGLQQKILSLVLVFLLITIGSGIAINFYKSYQLNSIVEDARKEQQQAISGVSEETMHKIIDSMLTKTNGLQAYIADDMFRSVKKDVLSLQTLAEGVFKGRNVLGTAAVYPPDPSTDGEITAQVLWEEGVDYTKSELLGTAALMTDIMKAMYKSSYYKTNCYIGLEDGTHLCVDDNASDKMDKDGNVITFPVRQRPWYTKAAESGEISFTGAIIDLYTNSWCVTCSAPVKVDGKLIGVVGIDLFLDEMSDYVNRNAANGGFIAVITDEGKAIFAPENNGVFQVNTQEKAEDIRKSGNKELADFVTQALSESTGMKTVTAGGKEYYAAGSPLPTVGWAAVSVVEKEITEQPTRQMLEEYDRINEKSTDRYADGSEKLRIQTMVMIVIILVLGTVAAIILANRIVKPIESMTREIEEGARTGKLFEMKPLYKTGDEIEVLAGSFDDLSKKTKQYIIDITRITKEKERIGTELELARKIQADMLPNIYPAFPDRPEFDIYATMHPAKEVGGDFYDFFLIDKDHLAMVMADVSGKGIPAALFMMMSKILIHNFAMLGGSPAWVLEKTNDTICQNNEEEMFVTVWFGILEIPTGRITAANAGHENPVIRTAKGGFEFFMDKHGLAVGGMEGMKYKEYELQLEKGGELFLYTDGIPEAINSDEEMFGPDRMLEILNQHKTTDPVKLLNAVKEGVDAFVGEAEQFDDLTMLGIALLE